MSSLGAAPGVAQGPGSPATPGRTGRARWLGRVSYDDALALQRQVHADRVDGRAPDTLLLLEHDSTYTAGRAAEAAHFLVSPEDLERAGHAVRETTRGGDVTWHGPGQLVAYPIVDLSDVRAGMRRDIHAYLRCLEDVLIGTCAEFGVEAWREEGRTGAWSRGGKIGAIGIRVARWVTHHGIALNVNPDLSHFDAIVPCGLQGAAVTSIQRELARAGRHEIPALHEVARVQVAVFARVFETAWMDGLEGLREEPIA